MESESISRFVLSPENFYWAQENDANCYGVRQTLTGFYEDEVNIGQVASESGRTYKVPTASERISQTPLGAKMISEIQLNSGRFYLIPLESQII